MLFAAIAVGLWMILGGIVVEPPAALMEAINKSNARLAAALWTACHSMSMMTNTLGRYFAGRFVVSAVGVFASIFVLLVLVDYIEMVRKTSGARFGLRDHGRADVAVPRAATARKDDAVLRPDRRDDLLPRAVAAARTGGSARRRRLGLAIHCAGAGKLDPRSASWPPTAYNPMSANLRELSKRMEAELFGSAPGGGIQDASGFWLNQINNEGQAIINAARSEQQGVRLTGLTVFRFDHRAAVQGTNRGARGLARRRALGVQRGTPILPRQAAGRPGQLLSRDHPDPGPGPQQLLHPRNCVILATTELHPLIGELGLCDRRLPAAVPQAHCTAVFAGCNGDVGGFGVSLRFFRFGGVQKMVLSGVGAGFLLYVLSKVTEDLSKAELMHPIAAAWLPVCVGGLTGFLALLYQEDG